LQLSTKCSVELLYPLNYEIKLLGECAVKNLFEHQISLQKIENVA